MCMKLHKSCHSEAILHRYLPAPQSKHAGNEIFANPHVIEASFFFNGKIWKTFEQFFGEQSAAGSMQRRPFTIDTNTFHPAARRAPLQDIPAELLCLQFRQPLLG